MTLNVSPIRTAFRAKIESKNCNHTCPDCGQPLVHQTEKEESKPKKGFFTKLKDGFINIRKGFIDFGYVLGGTIKGALYGAVTAAGVLGVAAAKTLIKNPNSTKVLGTGGKILAGLAGAVVMGVNIFKSKLDANEAKAKLDHRWETGHNE